MRSVPMAPAVAAALARLANRDAWTGDDDLVFPGVLGSYLDASALLKRYKRALVAAGLWPLRFHDLRHTFPEPLLRGASQARRRHGIIGVFAVNAHGVIRHPRTSTSSLALAGVAGGVEAILVASAGHGAYPYPHETPGPARTWARSTVMPLAAKAFPSTSTWRAPAA